MVFDTVEAMAIVVSTPRHPGLDLSETERIDYLIVVASMAQADGRISDTELLRLGQLCQHLGLSESGTERVLSAAGAPDRSAIGAILERLRDSALRFAVVVDAVDVAWADGRIDPAEAREVEALADRLGVTRSQVAMIQRYVAGRRNTATVDQTRELAAGLSATGIPIAALSLAATRLE
jgi:uncharacterized tellurite resistance protein B-like protein